MVSLDNEVFALRDSELVTLTETRPISGRWLAVQARSAQMPEGQRTATRPCDGAPVEQAAIIACEWNQTHEAWQWLQLSPPSKERIGDLLFDGGAELDIWYYLQITSTAKAAAESQVTFHKGEDGNLIVFFGDHLATEEERDSLLLWMEGDSRVSSLFAERFPR